MQKLYISLSRRKKQKLYMSSEPQTDQPLDNIKGSIEKISNSNAYCWIVLSACLAGLVLAFVFHQGTQYLISSSCYWPY